MDGTKAANKRSLPSVAGDGFEGKLKKAVSSAKYLHVEIKTLSEILNTMQRSYVHVQCTCSHVST